ncbi:MAG TPA: ribose-phosphate pyrophosphokinase [Patescibacteria group bacterium]|nr:ribose-phosphate pyrophosphokinase [Patescibacteria group bacterium]
MILVGDLNNPELSEKLSKELNVELIYPDKHIFPDGEMRVRILKEVVDQEVIVLKSHINPVDSSVMETCFLIDVLKRNGAGLVTGIIPYLGYMRADHMFRTGEGVPLEVVISMLENAGLAKAVLVDPHSIRIPELFHVPVVNLSALSVFADKIKAMNLREGSYTLVTPDMGGIRRIEILSKLLNGAPYATIEKNRDLETGSVEAAKVQGEIKETCFIVDDMISSGGTIIKGLKALQDQGAKNMYVMATHAVFSDNAPALLETSKAKGVFVTDSIPVPPNKKFKKLEIISIAKLLASSL